MSLSEYLFGTASRRELRKSLECNAADVMGGTQEYEDATQNALRNLNLRIAAHSLADIGSVLLATSLKQPAWLGLGVVSEGIRACSWLKAYISDGRPKKWSDFMHQPYTH